MSSTEGRCACHGEPAYWQRDSKMTAGGWWRCAVTKREAMRDYYETHGDRKLARQRDRYDRDPVYRIEKRLKQNACDRRKTIERRRAAIATDRGGQ